MTKRSPVIVVCVALWAVASAAFGGDPAARIAFTVSMEQPESHYFHVVMRCDGLAGGTQVFKLPAWTPGYYKIMDYARNVLDFRVEDGAGKPLSWEKTEKNAWRVATGASATLTVSYDVYAFGTSVADSFLDDGRAYISPTGVFMHVAGDLRNPVRVTIRPYTGWSAISTGLDPVEGQANTFSAPDFDTLYDCPILVGTQEILTFDVRGVPHTLALDRFGAFDRDRLTAHLKKVVEAAVAIIGEIPYRHYAFIAMGSGVGGLEHSNSTALMTDASGLNDPAGYRRWLSFVAHEFFHLYNVKRIRPAVLGPFDYDRENYTNMLWVSEGLTVYYDNLIVKRAGLVSRDQFLEAMQKNIAGYEHVPGHRFQSATEASFDTWIDFFDRNENKSNATISYYDKGAALGMLLDLKIRDATKNRRSLDDVMRALYQTFYKEKDRGFTDLEFRQTCEAVAGIPLPEIFDDYAATVKDIDYARYLRFAGLEIDLKQVEQPGAFLGAVTEDKDGKVVIASVERDSPAWRAGLSARDEVIGLDGVRITLKTLGELLDARKPGATVRVLVARRDRIREVDVVLGRKIERSFRITPLPSPTALQSAILKDWLRDP